MKILLDILHPAHVHFFRNAVGILRNDGHQVLVTARDKNLTLRLLDAYGLSHSVLSREAKSRRGLAAELISRNWRLAKIVRRERPDVMASIGGVSTAQVGFVTRTRNLIFYDTENATISNLLSYPLATRVLTPDCYRGKVLGRHVTYAGYHELAYLHPRRFTPDSSVLAESGLDADDTYSVVRFVSWRALHDVTARGTALDDRIRLVEALERHGRVFITSELPLPDELEPFRLPIPPERIHHLLAHASLFIGESATMASESVILGVPSVYLDPVGRGYTDEQESRFGLCFNYRPWQMTEAVARAETILSRGLKGDPGFRERVARLHAEKIDVTDMIVDELVERT